MKKYVFFLLTPFLIWQYVNYMPDIIEIWVDDTRYELEQPCFDLEPLCCGEHTIELGELCFWYWKSERENKKWIMRLHDLDYNAEDAKYFNESNLPYREKIRK